MLGVDGMDPGFLEHHWNSLPNVAHLRDTGGFRRLKTTMPPQSPVAWSTFITGLDPRGHGIFDFVHRDPKTMQPYSSMSRTEEPRFKLPIGPYVLPLSSARVETLRQGQAGTGADETVSAGVAALPVHRPGQRRPDATLGYRLP